MTDERAERLASNEALFRLANERKSTWEEREFAPEPELYMCECANLGCREKVTLGLDDYERVRRDSRHFLVVRGHEIPEIETVIEEHDGWSVIEKAPEVTRTVQALDPRRD